MGGVVDTVKDVVGGIGDVVEDTLGTVGNVVGKIPGLDSLGKEVERWGEDLNQVVKVASGEFHDDQKKVQKEKERVEQYGKTLEQKIAGYNLTVENMVERMESLIAFDEIYQMSMSNRLDEYVGRYGPEIEQMDATYREMVKRLEGMIEQLRNEYDFVIGLTEGAFIQKMIGSVIMIIGGLHSDLGDIVSGRADSDTFKRVVTVTAMVIAIVVLALVPGGQWAAVALMLTIIGTFLTLDGMYAGGAATEAVMGALDFIFNDLLNLDSLIGSDFEKFDKNHEDYQQMVGMVKLVVSLAAVMASFGASLPGTGTSMAAQTSAQAGNQAFVNAMKLGAQTSTAGSQAVSGAINSASSNLAQITYGTSQIGIAGTGTFLGISYGTYSDIYKAYSTAEKIGDIVSANKQYEDLKKKLKEDYDKLNQVILAKTNKNMMKHYKDTAYFLQDQQEQIDSYIWSMTAANMYVDPYGTTPVANIRFTPDKDTRGLGFGFEDLYDEDRLAGSKSYFNSIIYGS